MVSNAWGSSFPQFATTNVAAIKGLLLEHRAEESRLVIRALTNAGLNIECDTVRNAAEFQEKLGQKAYDLILCDSSLPGCNGLEALRWFRRHEPETPFIYFCGAQWDEDALRYIQAGATDYILKSDLTRLPDSVRRALDQRRLGKQGSGLQQELSTGRSREFDERLAIAFRCSPMAITISSRDEGLYLEVNDAFLRLVGRRREEAIGHTSVELGVWESVEERRKLIEDLDRRGAINSYETVVNSKSLGLRTVQVSAEIMHLDGIPYVLAVTNDVTEAKAVEEQLRQAQKMDAVGRLATGIAHDFNNMLGVIIGYCDLAERRSDEETVAKDVARIKKAARRAASLTSHLLTFSGQQSIHSSVVDLNAVVGDLLDMLLRVVAADADLQFVPGSDLRGVNVDPGQLEQMLLNLVLNARDAIPVGGKIVIATSEQKLDGNRSSIHAAARPGFYTAISVSDSGCGMSDQTISRIFEPFFTTKPQGRGTGLGLSMVQAGMEQAGGFVEVSSQEGKGTTFTLYFPAVETKATVSSAIAESPTRPPSETILLVEDEAALREVTAELLRREGYTVLESGDCTSAIGHARHAARSIDLLLTDIAMPGLSGCELARQIAQSHPKIKVVYMSGNIGALAANEGELDSHTGLLPKPFSRESLLRELRVLLDSDETDAGNTYARATGEPIVQPGERAETGMRQPCKSTGHADLRLGDSLSAERTRESMRRG